VSSSAPIALLCLLLPSLVPAEVILICRERRGVLRVVDSAHQLLLLIDRKNTRSWGEGDPLQQ